MQALATKLSDAKEALAAAAPQGIASEERLQAELREVTTQLRAAATRESEQAAAWAVLEEARRRLRAPSASTVAGEPSTPQALPTTLGKAWGVLCYWAEAQDESLRRVLLRWAESAGVRAGVAEMARRRQMLTSFVPRAELTRQVRLADAREAEHVAELQRLKQRLVLSSGSETHSRATLR